MESHKSKVLRITNTIYNIKCGITVNVINSDNDEYIFKCQYINGNYDLYDLNGHYASCGMFCDTLDDLKDSLLRAVLDGVLTNITLC